jgi:hypothetical protein
MSGSVFLAIFWGLFFTLLGLDLWGVGWVLSVLGFVALAWGIGRARPLSPPLRRACALAVLLTPAPMLRLVPPLESPWSEILTAVTVLVIFLKMAMVWELCGGVHRCAPVWGKPRLGPRALLCRVIFVIGYGLWFAGLVLGAVLAPRVSTVTLGLVMLPFALTLVISLAFLGAVVWQASLGEGADSCSQSVKSVSSVE